MFVWPAKQPGVCWFGQFGENDNKFVIQRDALAEERKNDILISLFESGHGRQQI